MGLGNPGDRYRRTRHNLGFWVAEGLVQRWVLSRPRRLGRGLVSLGRVEGRVVAVYRPLTYMNLSGPAVKHACQSLGIDAADLLVIHDDLDLEPGRLRMRPGGSSGGHRGVESIIVALGSEHFPRLRIGIGRPPETMEAADYVLLPLDKEEEMFYRSVVEKAIDGCTQLVRDGLDIAMGWVNSNHL